jgi:hypothetical protein
MNSALRVWLLLLAMLALALFGLRAPRYHAGSYKRHWPPNPWVLTVTTEHGSTQRYNGYRSKEECESNIEKIEREMNAKNGHCDPWGSPSQGK